MYVYVCLCEAPADPCDPDCKQKQGEKEVDGEFRVNNISSLFAAFCVHEAALARLNPAVILWPAHGSVGSGFRAPQPWPRLVQCVQLTGSVKLSLRWDFSSPRYKAATRETRLPLRQLKQNDSRPSREEFWQVFSWTQLTSWTQFSDWRSKLHLDISLAFESQHIEGVNRGTPSTCCVLLFLLLSLSRPGESPHVPQQQSHLSNKNKWTKKKNKTTAGDHHHEGMFLSHGYINRQTDTRLCMFPHV